MYITIIYIYIYIYICIYSFFRREQSETAENLPEAIGTPETVFRPPPRAGKCQAKGEAQLGSAGGQRAL